MSKPKILIVEDDSDIRELLQYSLAREGNEVAVAADGTAAMTTARRLEPDLVLLDLMLPGVDGLEVCRQLRSDRATAGSAIIMVTAKGEESDVVLGLGLGADDYVLKPFKTNELVARVKAVLRRTKGGEMPLVELLRFDAGRLEIDSVRHEVRIAGHPVGLTPSEYKLLFALAQYPGRAYSRFELINRVQGHDFEGYERTIDAHVKNLRRKIEPDPRRPHYVETVQGIGYRLGLRRE